MALLERCAAHYPAMGMTPAWISELVRDGRGEPYSKEVLQSAKVQQALSSARLDIAKWPEQKQAKECQDLQARHALALLPSGNANVEP